MDHTEQIWKDYHQKLHGFIQGRVGDASVADDVLQDVFVRIHSRIDTLKQAGNLQGWIYQITRNAIIDYYRSRQKTAELPTELPSADEDFDEQYRQEVSRCMLPLIDALPDNYREAIMLSEIEGLTQQEVARRQGLSLSGAKSRIQRGRSMIKEMLTDCCRFEFDRRGKVIDYQRRDRPCDCQ